MNAKPGLFRRVLDAAIEDRGLFGVVEVILERFSREEVIAAIERAEKTSARVQKARSGDAERR